MILLQFIHKLTTNVLTNQSLHRRDSCDRNNRIFLSNLNKYDMGMFMWEFTTDELGDGRYRRHLHNSGSCTVTQRLYIWCESEKSSPTPQNFLWYFHSY